MKELQLTMRLQLTMHHQLSVQGVHDLIKDLHQICLQKCRVITSMINDKTIIKDKTTIILVIPMGIAEQQEVMKEIEEDMLKKSHTINIHMRYLPLFFKSLCLILGKICATSSRAICCTNETRR